MTDFTATEIASGLNELAINPPADSPSLTKDVSLQK